MPELDRLKRTSIEQQGRLVQTDQFAPLDRGFAAPISALFPSILKGSDFRAVVEAIVAARRAGLPVLAMYGAHVLKVGVGPLLARAVRDGAVTALATNGAGVIHDVELARYGRTSEDVAEGLADGSFGMAIETGRELNLAINAGVARGLGLGAAVGAWLREQPLADAAASPLLAATQAGAPLTVHVALGTDIIHQHPEASGAALGEGSLRDFRALCDHVGLMQGGGVALCLGSAVIMPEVFLKAVTVARNLNPAVGGFTTAVFDMNDHYRPRVNVAERPPAQLGGRGYYFVGHHELMLPILFHDVALALAS